MPKWKLVKNVYLHAGINNRDVELLPACWVIRVMSPDLTCKTLVAKSCLNDVLLLLIELEFIVGICELLQFHLNLTLVRDVLRWDRKLWSTKFFQALILLYRALLALLHLLLFLLNFFHECFVHGAAFLDIELFTFVIFWVAALISLQDDFPQ